MIGCFEIKKESKIFILDLSWVDEKLNNALKEIKLVKFGEENGR